MWLKNLKTPPNRKSVQQSLGKKAEGTCLSLQSFLTLKKREREKIDGVFSIVLQSAFYISVVRLWMGT